MSFFATLAATLATRPLFHGSTKNKYHASDIIPQKTYNFVAKFKVMGANCSYKAMYDKWDGTLREPSVDTITQKIAQRDNARIIPSGAYAINLGCLRKFRRISSLSYGDLDFIKSIAGYIQRGNLPTATQCKRLFKIIAKLEDKGYMMP